jgi:peptidoglycan/xylan/chitin deacetylase (PgdA/CDA1 family)
LGTEKVLDKLQEANVTGTFFVNGYRVDSVTGPILTRAEREGHVLAHHTFNHASVEGKVVRTSSGQLNEDSRAFFQKQISDNAATFAPYLPLKGLRPFFRPPYLSIDGATATYLKDEYDLYVVQINVDTRDYEAQSSAQIADNFNRSLFANASEHSWISLQHDEHGITADAIPLLVEIGEDLGYRFVGLDECLDFPREVFMNATLGPTPIGALETCLGEPCEGENCRSKFGFCGNTVAHCTDEPQWIPTCSRNVTDVPGLCTGDSCSKTGHCRSRFGSCGKGVGYCNSKSLWRPDCGLDTDGGSLGFAPLASTSLAVAVLVCARLIGFQF